MPEQIERKQWYSHKKSALKLQVLNVSAMHPEHFHVGVMLNGKIVMNCHVHQKDIEDSWDKIFPASS